MALYLHHLEAHFEVSKIMFFYIYILFTASYSEKKIYKLKD